MELLRRSCLVSLLLLLFLPLTAQLRRDPPAPFYTADSILNAASGVADAYCPYGLIAIHGRDLALTTARFDFEHGSLIPRTLGGARVFMRNQEIGILTVTPDEIVAILPPDLNTGPGSLQVAVAGIAGPAIPLVVRPATPALFMQAEGVVACTNDATSQDVTMENPATPGTDIVLFATGLGAMRPSPVGFELLKRQAPVINRVDVELDGIPIAPSSIRYAGLQPGLAGAYQIKLRVPDGIGDYPTIRLHSSGMFSQEGLRLPVRSSSPQDSGANTRMPDRR